MRKLLRTFLLAFIGILPIIYSILTVLPARAIDNPESISLIRNKAFTGVFENNDMLFLSEYEVTYADNATPTETPAEAFNFALYDDGSVLVNMRPLASTTYGYNVIGLYFSAAEVTSNSLVWGSSYKVRVTGNPALFASLTEGVNMATYTFTAVDWISGTYGDADTQVRIKDYCIGIATNLQTEWQQTLIALVAAGYVLNSLGRVTFLLAVPNFDFAVPILFQTTYNNPDLTGNTYTQGLQAEYTPLGQLGADAKAAFDGIGEWLGFSGEMLGAMWAFMLILMVTSIAFLYTGNTTASILIAIPMGFIGLITGFFPIYIFIIIIALILVYSGYYLFLRGI